MPAVEGIDETAKRNSYLLAVFAEQVEYLVAQNFLSLRLHVEGDIFEEVDDLGQVVGLAFQILLDYEVVWVDDLGKQVV